MKQSFSMSKKAYQSEWRQCSFRDEWEEIGDQMKGPFEMGAVDTDYGFAYEGHSLEMCKDQDWSELIYTRRFEHFNMELINVYHSRLAAALGLFLSFRFVYADEEA
jgi:hypothetical protein